MIFLDRAKLFVSGGAGGDGCASFRREKFVPRGGPNGGDGGKGGDIYFEASSHVNTLYRLSLNPHIKADRGEHGLGKDQYGRSGKDVIVAVPEGTIVYDLTIPASIIPSQQEQDEARLKGVLLGELLKPGERLLVAKGGRGGRGNTAFKSNFNRAPREAEKGFPGEEKTLLLELKILADVGIAGLPNAGKSSLLARLTAARPKIAAYPFTTTHPVLGLCLWRDRRLLIADIPGLIEGAHQGRGLGHEFLRHIERTRALIHLIEPKEKGVMEDIRTVEREMGAWEKGLLKKPRLMVVSKADLGDLAQRSYREIRRRRPKAALFLISTQTGQGVTEMLDALARVALAV